MIEVTEKMKEKIFTIADYYEEKQLDQTVEECSELIQAIMKFKKKRNEGTIHNIAEEIADVWIMLQQLIYLNNEVGRTVEGIVEEKLDRQLKRIEKEIEERYENS